MAPPTIKVSFIYMGTAFSPTDLPGSDARIGALGAFWRGLPSVCDRYAMAVLMALLPLAAFGPALAQYWRRMRGKAMDGPRPTLSLYHRCLCVLFAYIFLIGPENIQSLAAAEIQYANLHTTTWGQSGDTIAYGYDANGSLTTKTTTRGGLTAELVEYEYSLRGELKQVTTTPYTGGVPGTEVVTQYKYNPQGIRVSQKVGTTETTYLVDPYNPTGYAQVLEEWTGGSTPAVTYTIGDDVIGQSVGTTVSFLLYDGHGSTRQLSGTSAGVSDNFSYDAYGMMLGGNPTTASPAATKLLYAGEQFDPSLGHYYLRARYYNPSNGRFNQTDPFAGNPSDPQSLHKYLYAHCNPVNGTDPTGKMTFIEVTAIASIISTMLSVAIPVTTATIVAIRAGVSPWEYFSQLFAAATWQEALIALGVGIGVSALIKPIVKELGKRGAAVIGLAFSLWSLFTSIQLSIQMARNTQLSKREIAHYLAVLTASTVLAIFLGKVARHIQEMRGQGYKRPYLRQDLRKEIMSNALRTAEGKFIDPNTKKPIEGAFQFGHTYGNEHRRLVERALARGMTQKEFNDWVNNHPEWFQIEDPVSNMSHEFEMLGP